MPADTTTVPAVLAALVALGRTVLGSDFPVFDGPPPDDPPDEFLSIGFSRDDEEPAVDGNTADEGNYTTSEAYTVRCLLSAARGDSHDTATAEVRARCAYLHGLLASALRSDPTLDGTLTGGGRVFPGSWSWVYGPTADGAVCDIEFEVAVSANYLGMA